VYLIAEIGGAPGFVMLSLLQRQSVLHAGGYRYTEHTNIVLHEFVWSHPGLQLSHPASIWTWAAWTPPLEFSVNPICLVADIPSAEKSSVHAIRCVRAGLKIYRWSAIRWLSSRQIM
jgi:hypothetical protein